MTYFEIRGCGLTLKFFTYTRYIAGLSHDVIRRSARLTSFIGAGWRGIAEWCGMTAPNPRHCICITSSNARTGPQLVKHILPVLPYPLPFIVEQHEHLCLLYRSVSAFSSLCMELRFKGTLLPKRNLQIVILFTRRLNEDGHLSWPLFRA